MECADGSHTYEFIHFDALKNSLHGGLFYILK